MNYATLTQVKAYLGQAPSGVDNVLLDFLDQASRFIEHAKGRRFDVRRETRLFDIPGLLKRTPIGYYPGLRQNNYNSQPLALDEDLLSLTTLTNGDGTVITSAEYVLEPGNRYPKKSIRLTDTSWALPTTGIQQQAISVNGLWGFHDNYLEAWVDSMNTVQDVSGISANVTLLKVGDVDGIAADLRGPRFQSGQLIKIGDELILIISTNTSTNEMIIKRGYNGSTAAIHANGAAISIFRPMGIVEISCIRLVVWRYKQKDVDNFDKTYVMGSGMVNVPTSLPSDVVRFLGAHKVDL
jgi:hypothetical protein